MRQLLNLPAGAYAAPSALWAASVLTSHTIATRVDVLYGGITLASNLAVAAGSVNLDRSAKSLATLQITLAEPLRIEATDGLSPYGYELAVWRGIAYPDGTSELAPLGVFPIQTSELGEDLLTVITARDRSQAVVDARFEDDYQIAAGTNYATAIQALIVAGVPSTTFSFASTTFTTPLLTFGAQSDRWEAAQGMARSIGCEIYFDGRGICVLRAEPSATLTPAWSILEGNGGALLDARISLDRAPAYNRVIAFGENADNTTAVPRGVATDANPISPSYYFGPFGKKPRFYSSPFLKDDTQAAAAALAILNSQLGVARALDLSALPNPALEPGDAVRATRARLGLDEVHLIDSITVGLTAGDGGMRLGTRRQDTA